MHLYWHLGHYQSFTYVCSAIDWWEPEWLPKMFRRCRISRPRTFYVSDRFFGIYCGWTVASHYLFIQSPVWSWKSSSFQVHLTFLLLIWPNWTLVLKGRCSSFDRRWYEVSWWVNFFLQVKECLTTTNVTSLETKNGRSPLLPNRLQAFENGRRARQRACLAKL